MHINTLVQKLNAILPPESAMKGDKIGIQLKCDNEEIQNVLVTMEISDEVAEEAIKLNAELIITFHPLIYSPMQQIDNQERVGRIVQKLIKNDISVISAHTTFDAHKNGTNSVFAEMLDLEFQSFLIKDKFIDEAGMGVIAMSKVECDLATLVERVSKLCNSPVKFTNGKNQNIKKIAIVCGSGSSFLDDVEKANVDAFITADISYHTFHRAKGNIALIDPGHYEMEQFVNLAMANLIKDNFAKDELQNVWVSKEYTNPVSYFPETQYYIEKQKNYLSKI